MSQSQANLPNTHGGVRGTINANASDAETRLAELESPTTVQGMSTGLISGGEITINADDTKFDVAAGSGIIVDTTDPTNVTRTEVSWDAMEAVVPTHIADHGTSFMLIDSGGNLIQQVAFPTSTPVRTYIQIGSIVHGDNTIITSTSDFTSASIFNTAADLNDLQVAMGVINIGTGNNYSGVSGTLSVQKSAGNMFYFAIQRKLNPENPNNIVTPASVAPLATLTWRDGLGGHNSTTSTVVTAGVFDDDSGGASAPTDTLLNNSWANHRIHYSPDAVLTVIQYGQVSYNSSTAAVTGIATEVFEGDPSFAGVPLRGILTMRGGATDLSLSGDAFFTPADRNNEV